MARIRTGRGSVSEAPPQARAPGGRWGHGNGLRRRGRDRRGERAGALPGLPPGAQYTAAVLPCTCGAPLAPPLLVGAPPEPVTHRTWSDGWVTVRCEACGRQDQWPQPELNCSCGTVLRIPVRQVSAPPSAAVGTGPAAARSAFRPMTIRTARDAVSAAAHYLQWLGFHNLQQPGRRPLSGIDLRGPGLVATVEATTRPAALRDVECLWLNGLSASAVSASASHSRGTPTRRAPGPTNSPCRFS